MAGVSLSGLASGVDTATIVDQLMALERQSLVKHSRAQARNTAQQTVLRDVTAKLKALGAASGDLKSSAMWVETQVASSSDATRVAVSQPRGVIPPTTVSIKVNALATGGQTRYGAWVPPAADTKLWVADGVGVNLAKGASVEDAAMAINGLGREVFAGVVDGRLVLTSRATGAAVPAPELREGATWADGIAAPGTGRAGTNADLLVNGVADASRSTNDFWLAEQGLRVTLKAASTTDVSLTATAPSLDKSAVKDRLKAFVSAYNDLVTLARKQLDEKPVKSPGSDFDARTGSMYADSGLNAVLSTLRKELLHRVPGLNTIAAPNAAPDELFDIGISTGKSTGAAASADAKVGRISIDDAKLDAALADPLAVRALFSGREGVQGLSAHLDSIITDFTKTGAALDVRVKAVDDRNRTVRDQLAAAEKRIEAKEKRLKAQFAAMEQAMGSAQQQGNWLAGQMAGLSGLNR